MSMWTRFSSSGGGGGSTPGAGIVRGPFNFAFNTAGLANGVVFYTPTIGDHLLDAIIIVDVAFDGTTPNADIGTFVGQNGGLFKAVGNSVIDLSTLADEGGGTGVLISENGATPASLVGANAYNGSRSAWGIFTAGNPLKLVVSQTGAKSGTAIGGTAGSGRIYIVTATPVAF